MPDFRVCPLAKKFFQVNIINSPIIITTLTSSLESSCVVGEEERLQKGKIL